MGSKRAKIFRRLGLRKSRQGKRHHKEKAQRQL